MDRICASNPDYLTVDPRNNRLLALLPPSAWQRWRPHLELVHLHVGQSLCHSGEYPSHVYFPTTASVSILHVTQGGASAEMAAIGNFGMVGLSAIMGGGTTSGHAVVRNTGHGFRLNSARMRAEFHSSGPVMRLLLLYVQALMNHIALIALCNQHHGLEKRLCRCLLTTLDHAQSSALNMTHETAARLLGVRREGVTAAAQTLQRAGVIDYARGHVSVLDRSALKMRCCECYAAVKIEYERLLPKGSSVHERQLQAEGHAYSHCMPCRPAPRATLTASNTALGQAEIPKRPAGFAQSDTNQATATA